MRTKHTLLKIGLPLILGFHFVLTGIAAAQSEYMNPALPNKDTAAYWLDQGGLLSTYGNYPAAIHAYEKTLKIDPSNSEAHFDMGLAYAEMADYPRALANIDKAIFLSADNGRYFYGRAWVLMLSGQSEKALSDFEKAAELGSTDAKMYLQRQLTEK